MNVTIYFGFKDAGKQAVAKKIFGSLVPAIDTKGFVGISIDKNKDEVKIHGNVSGDDFPDAEAFLYDAAGHGINLGDFKHSVFGSPIKDLPGEGNSMLINFNITIKLDKNGNFISASAIKDGKSTKLKIYDKKETNFDSSTLAKP